MKTSIKPLLQAAQIIVTIVSLKLMFDAIRENKDSKRPMGEWDK